MRRHIGEVEKISLVGRVSESALGALTRVGISMYNMAVSCGDDRTQWSGMIERLHRICRRRCSKRYSFGRRCRMMPVLYDLLHGAFRAPEARRAECCSRYMHEIISAWLDGKGQAEGWAAEYPVLRTIADCCYEVPRRQRGDRAYAYLASRIAAWTAALEEGEWQGVSAEEALQRIDIMCRDAYMYMDGARDRRMERLYDRCYERVMAEMEQRERMTMADCRMLTLLYDIAVYGLRRAESDRVAHIVQLARRGVHTLRERSDARLLCRALCIDSLCMEQAQRVEQEIFGNIA